MASPSPVHRVVLHRHQETTSAPHELTITAALPDDLLEQIFLRIACPASLIRASAASISFRRLISDGAFLRRYRSRHPPLLLGFLAWRTLHPVQRPHPNASAAHTLKSNITSFVSKHLRPLYDDLGGWYISDVHDGRVLFHGHPRVFGRDPDDGDLIRDLVVYDPSSLSWKHLPLPPVPVVQVVPQQNLPCLLFETALAPHAGGGDDETSFRVICTMTFKTKFVVSVFDSASSSWALGTCVGWQTLGFSNGQGGDARPTLCGRCYAYGCLYWKAYEQNTFLKLQIDTMEFSRIDSPPGHAVKHADLVEAGEGRLGLFGCKAGDRNTLYYYIYNDKCAREGDAHEWQLKNVLPLPVNVYDDSHRTFPGVGAFLHGVPLSYDGRRIFPGAGACLHQGCVLLQGCTKNQLAERRMVWSLDIETLKFEKVTEMMTIGSSAKPYFGFPPFIAARRV